MDATAAFPSDPAFMLVQLTGPADLAASVMTTLSSQYEVTFGPVLRPCRDGDVACTAQLVTHDSPHPERAGQTVLVAVQTVLEVEPGVLPGLPGAEAAQQVEALVRAAVSSLPGVREASSRFVSVVGLPAAGRG